jgi:hypothetical protein
MTWLGADDESPVPPEHAQAVASTTAGVMSNRALEGGCARKNQDSRAAARWTAVLAQRCRDDITRV